MTAWQRLLRVRPEEARTARLMLGALLVGWSATAVGANGVESLLLGRVGAGVLPGLFLVLAGANLIVILALGRTLRGGTSARILVRALLGLAVVVAAIRLVLEVDGAEPAAWLVMMVGWTVATPVWWGIAGSVHDTRQAKRLFPLYGGAVILGIAVGGFLTPVLAAALGVENLVWVWAAGLLGGAALARLVVRPGPRIRRTAAAASPGRTVLRSGLLRWMWVFLAAAGFLYYTLALLFAQGVTARFAEPDQIASFYGVFTGATSGTALLVSLFVANRLFAVLGVAAMILVLAGVYAVGFAGLLLTPAFAVLVAFRFAQLVWVNGVWSGGWQALLNVVPTARRDRVRAFLDATALQAGVAVAGLVGLTAGRTSFDPAVAGVAVGVVGIGAAWAMRRSYAGALVDALREGNPEVFARGERPFGGFVRDRHALSVAARLAADADAGVRGIAVAVLAEAGGQEGILARALEDPDPRVRASAVRGLGGTGSIPPSVLALARDDAPVVRRAVVLALAPTEHRTILEGALGDDDAEVRAAAAGALARAGDRTAGSVLVSMTSGSREECLAALRELGPDLADGEALGRAMACLGDDDPDVRAAAADVVAGAGDLVVPALVALVELDDGGVGAASTLGRIRPGHPALEAFVGDRLRRAADYLGYAASLPEDRDGRVALLEHALRTAAFEAASGALAVPSAKGDPAEIRLAMENLRSRDPAQRANALETLEAVADARSVRTFVAAWEGGTTRPAPEREVLRILADDPDPWVRATARFVRQDGAVEALSKLAAMERMVFLRRVPLFADLAPADLEHVADAAVEHAFRDGDVVAEEGELGDELHIVVEGAIRVLSRGSELARRGPGEYVGEMAVVSGEPRMASLVCQGSVRTLGLDRARFERILRERPDVAIAAMRVLSQRLREAHATTGSST